MLQNTILFSYEQNFNYWEKPKNKHGKNKRYDQVFPIFFSKFTLCFNLSYFYYYHYYYSYSYYYYYYY